MLTLCLLSAGGVDYVELIEVSVIFSPGVSSQTVNLTTLSDLPAEGDEDLRARLQTSDSSVVIVVPEANITITEESMYVQRKMHVYHILKTVSVVVYINDCHFSQYSKTVLQCTLVSYFLSSVSIVILFTTDDVEVIESEAVAEVCLRLNVPLTTDLEVAVSSTASGSATGGNME